MKGWKRNVEVEMGGRGVDCRGIKVRREKEREKKKKEVESKEVEEYGKGEGKEGSKGREGERGALVRVLRGHALERGKAK